MNNKDRNFLPVSTTNDDFVKDIECTDDPITYRKNMFFLSKMCVSTYYTPIVLGERSLIKSTCVISVINIYVITITRVIMFSFEEF